jgi:hypothetical protein
MLPQSLLIALILKSKRQCNQLFESIETEFGNCGNLYGIRSLNCGQMLEIFHDFRSGIFTVLEMKCMEMSGLSNGDWLRDLFS